MLTKILTALERRYGHPDLPPAKGPFELVLWENAVYLLPDERRAEVFEALRSQVGLTAETIWKAPENVLLPLAARGGMHPETRVLRWREIASITLQQFGGDLDQVLALDFGKAKKALKQFPSIGDPGAEKILMYCGKVAGLPLESNGLRALVRIGYGNQQAKNYGAMYKSAQEAVAGELPKGAEELSRAHLVLRTMVRLCVRMPAPNASNAPSRSTARSSISRQSYQGWLRRASSRRLQSTRSVSRPLASCWRETERHEGAVTSSKSADVRRSRLQLDPVS